MYIKHAINHSSLEDVLSDLSQTVKNSNTDLGFIDVFWTLMLSEILLLIYVKYRIFQLKCKKFLGVFRRWTN